MDRSSHGPYEDPGAGRLGHALYGDHYGHLQSTLKSLFQSAESRFLLIFLDIPELSKISKSSCSNGLRTLLGPDIQDTYTWWLNPLFRRQRKHP
jgi:hypothetical protein